MSNNTRFRIIIGAIAIAVISMSVFGVSAAAVLNVNAASGTVLTGAPCPVPRTSATYKHIQAAVNCAESGDVLLIAAGTYVENVTIAKNLTLTGVGAATTTISGSGVGRTITVTTVVAVSLNNLTISGGAATDGAGVHTSASTLTLNRVTLSGNNASARGGAIFTEAGTVNLLRSIVSGNSAPNGGGIYSAAGTVNVTGGTVTANSATGAGGGVYTQGGTLNASSNAVTANSAPTGTNVQSIVGAITDGGLVTFIDAAVGLQGRPAAPNARLIVPLNVRIVPQAGGAAVFDQPVTTDPGGTFVVQLVPGTYRMRVSGAASLARVVNLTLVTGDNAITVPTLLAGDANADNVVNITDFSILAATFGKAAGQPGYDTRPDYNGDDVVNITDFSLLAANFGRVGESL